MPPSRESAESCPSFRSRSDNADHERLRAGLQTLITEDPTVRENTDTL